MVTPRILAAVLGSNRPIAYAGLGGNATARRVHSTNVPWPKARQLGSACLSAAAGAEPSASGDSNHLPVVAVQRPSSLNASGLIFYDRQSNPLPPFTHLANGHSSDSPDSPNHSAFPVQTAAESPSPRAAAGTDDDSERFGGDEVARARISQAARLAACQAWRP